MTPTLDTRGSGVLLHPTSLPGGYGVGDLGPEAFRFVEQLAKSQQSWWQMLPLGPPGKSFSPYMATSAFALSPLLLSLDGLVRSGLLKKRELRGAPAFIPGQAHYESAQTFREPLLRQAFVRFEEQPRRKRAEFNDFCDKKRAWLSDFALFCALTAANHGASWTKWDPELRKRERAALTRARRELAEEIRFHQFLQYQVHLQWTELKRACRKMGVGLIGDIPIFVSHDSADVWQHQQLFKLDTAGRPKVVAGTPPDYFTKTGQLWHNPIYRWNVMRRNGYRWWIARLRNLFEQVDVARMDHFIGFHRHWEVPAGAKTAAGGRFVAGPGPHFFDTLFRKLGKVELIAEDLGVVTPEVKLLRDRYDLPGMKVLQFAFGNDPEAENYQPHTFPRHAVVYTGTHDNDTVVGWYRDTGTASTTRTKKEIRREREFAKTYLGSDGREIHWDMIRMAWLSVADTAIVPCQDLLGLPSSARMNRPGTATGNWRWRLSPDRLTDVVLGRLCELTKTYGRARHG